MRIAFFTETFLPKIDGIVNTLCHLLRYLEAHGHEAMVIAPEGGPLHYAGAKIIGLPGYPFPLYPELKLVPPYVDVEHSLRSFRPDLIHVVNPISLGLVGIRHARQLGLPVVASYHTDIPGFAQRWGLQLFVEPLWAYLRWIHDQADLNLCPSQATLRDLAARGFERLQVWTRGVDSQTFHPMHRSEEWRWRLTDGHPGAPLLLYVGRVTPEKRIEWIRDVLEAIPGARLAVVGDGPHRPQLEMHFAGTPTVFTGYLSGQDLARAYASADIFIFPAANETFGNVVLEAMASGLAVVAANLGGPVGIIKQQVTGLLFEPEDRCDLVRKTLSLTTNQDFANQLRYAARQAALDMTWNAVFDQLILQYETLSAPTPIWEIEAGKFAA